MSSPYKLHVHRWAKYKPLNLLTVTMAQQIAVGAEMVHDLVLWLREGVVDEKLPPRPRASEWLGLYHEHRRVFLAGADEVPHLLGDGQAVGQMLDETRSLSTWARNDPEEIGEWLQGVSRRQFNRWLRGGIRLAHRTYKRHLLELQRNVREPEHDGGGDLADSLSQSPELYFFMRVTLPCLVVHRRHPLSLLRRARQGDMAAIEALARVDDLVIYDPAIEGWASQQPGPVRQERIKLLDHWRSQGLDHGQFSPRQVKLSLAGLIAGLVETMGAVADWRGKRLIWPKLTAEEIRDLFHAAARDRAGRARGVYDEDLADLQTKSMGRQIARQKRLWKPILPGNSSPAGDGQKSA